MGIKSALKSAKDLLKFARMYKKYIASGDIRKIEEAKERVREMLEKGETGDVVAVLASMVAYRLVLLGRVEEGTKFARYAYEKTGDPLILEKLAIALGTAGHNEEELKVAKELYEKYPDRPDIIATYILALAEFDTDEALRLADEALKKMRDACLMLCKAEILLKIYGEIGKPDRKLLDEAEALLEEASKTLKDNPTILAELAFINEEKGEIERGMRLIEKALNLNPIDPQAWYRYAAFLMHFGRFKDALDAIDRALALNPSYYEALKEKAHLLEMLGRLDEAMETIGAALRLRPDDIKGLMEQCDILSKMGRLDEAEACWMRCLKLAPNNFWVLLDLARFYFYKKHDVDRALEFLGRLERLGDPSWSATYCLLKGDVLVALGRRDEARRFFELGLRLAGDSPYIRRVFLDRLKKLR